MSGSAVNPPAFPGHSAESAAIYLHIPFCRTKCLYCSFNSHAGREDLIAAYCQALHREIKVMADHPWCRGRSFFSLYIGGGTPTICPGAQLAELIGNCLASFRFSADPEITVEANPNSLSAEKLSALRAAGVNRLSIGVQSFVPEDLVRLGRSHTAQDALQAMALARSAGFANINLDLMYGLPGQTTADWRQTLATAAGLNPEHLSLYELMIEEKTPFAALLARGEISLPLEDEVADMEEITAARLVERGYRRYEISNYAREGYQCRHNINYWQNRSWLGLGAGATGSLSGTRVTNVADPLDYVQRMTSNHEPYSSMECLCRQALFRETMIMGLRMLAGVSISELEQRFAISPLDYYGAALRNLLTQGLLVHEKGLLRLSEAALPIANQVLTQLV
jgi:oxygen-independent coproporphyrinogen-3 oxidase